MRFEEQLTILYSWPLEKHACEVFYTFAALLDKIVIKLNCSATKRQKVRCKKQCSVKEKENKFVSNFRTKALQAIEIAMKLEGVFKRKKATKQIKKSNKIEGRQKGSGVRHA